MGHYLVTGAAGFIGSKVAELLLSDGHAVVGIDSLNDAYDIRLKNWRLEHLVANSNFSFHQVDICDREALGAIFDKQDEFEAVVNLAARAGVRYSVENPWVYFATNAIGTLNLLEQCRLRAVRKFVLASTSSLYGSHNPLPYHEDADTDRPLSPYAASKKGAEALAYTYHHLHGVDVTVLRYFTVYGPAGRPDMSVFRFVRWIHEGQPVVVYGDGTQSRDFTYIDDIARGTVAACRPLGYQVVNLGSDRPVVLSDLIKVIEQLLDRDAMIEFQPAHPADAQATWANIERAKQHLDWEPKTDYREGLAETVRWYLNNRNWAKDIGIR